jgi:hypothetical protein
MPMKNDDSSLESLLRATPLREPSERMDVRVEAVFANHRAHAARRSLRLSLDRISRHRPAIAAGILIAIGIGFRLSLPKPKPPVAIVPETVASHPFQIEQDTSTLYNDGMIAGTDDGAYLQIRRRTVREIWYEDPSTHAKLQVTIPTEQVVIQKVEAY